MTLIRRVNNNYPLFQNWLEDFIGTVDNGISNRFRTTVPAVNIAETENSYEIFVYLRKPGKRYDELIGYQKINTIH